MKLRIQDNSLRFRLTRKEVDCLRDRGIIESTTRFSANRALRYSVASSPDAAVVFASYRDDSIGVVLPSALAMRWANSGEVTIEAYDSGIHILVEKDFQCLHQSVERDPEAYPNPLA